MPVGYTVRLSLIWLETAALATGVGGCSTGASDTDSDWFGVPDVVDVVASERASYDAPG